MDVARATFEAVLQTVRVADQQKLAEQRERALSRAQQWRQRLKPKQLHAALQRGIFLRMVRQDTDIGYMQVDQYTTEVDKTPGVRVDVKLRMQVETTAVRSVAHFFVADDGRSEYWSTRIERLESADPHQPQPKSTAYVTTGIRTGRQLQIAHDGPTGHTAQTLETPPIGYLSQVEALLLPQILPREQPATFSFYWYHAERDRITLRTDQVTPTVTGYVVASRPSPNEPEQQTTCDGQGKVTAKRLAGGIRILPTDAATIQRLWRGR